VDPLGRVPPRTSIDRPRMPQFLSDPTQKRSNKDCGEKFLSLPGAGCRESAMRNLLSVIAFCAFLGACSSAEKYAANQSATERWLGGKQGSADVRVSGTWEEVQSGWGGPATFVQHGSRISGVLGRYSAKGVLNGSTVYLALESSGWTYYTAVLKKHGDRLGGFYSSSVPFSSSNQGDLNLRRIPGPSGN